MSETKARLDAVILALMARPAPTHLVVGAYQFDVLHAYRQFEGRDWRRIKREVRKASERHRTAKRAKGDG